MVVVCSHSYTNYNLTHTTIILAISIVIVLDFVVFLINKSFVPECFCFTLCNAKQWFVMINMKIRWNVMQFFKSCFTFSILKLPYISYERIHTKIVEIDWLDRILHSILVIRKNHSSDIYFRWYHCWSFLYNTALYPLIVVYVCWSAIPIRKKRSIDCFLYLSEHKNSSQSDERPT